MPQLVEVQECVLERDELQQSFNGTNPNWSGTTWFYQVPGLAIAQPFGLGCGAPALTVREDPNARPRLGSPFGFDILNVPAGVAFVCFGWSRRAVLGLGLPMPMAQWGLPGCWLLQSDDAIMLPAVSAAPGAARFAMGIPAAPTFTGLSFHLQPWAPAPGANPANAAIGDAVGVTIGSW